MTFVFSGLALDLCISLHMLAVAQPWGSGLEASQMNSYPADLRYTKEHEWCRVDGDIATVGITAYAVERLGGEITLVELTEEGAEVRQDESFGTIESVKAASELYAPVSGSVSEVNEELADNPELTAESPYSDGWMLRIHMSDKGELGSLMDSAAYGKYVEESEE